VRHETKENFLFGAIVGAALIALPWVLFFAIGYFSWAADVAFCAAESMFAATTSRPCAD